MNKPSRVKKKSRKSLRIHKSKKHKQSIYSTIRQSDGLQSDLESSNVDQKDITDNIGISEETQMEFKCENCDLKQRIRMCLKNTD